MLRRTWEITRQGAPRCGWLPVLLGACLLVGPGCRLLKETTAVPQRTVQAMTGTRPSQPDPVIQLQRVMRFADDATARIARTSEEYLEGATSQAEVVAVMRARLAHTRAVISVVTTPNSNLAALDAVAVATLTRLSLETFVQSSAEESRYLPVLHTVRAIETNAWSLLSDLISPQQQQELRAYIEAYCRENPVSVDAVMTRPQQFPRDLRRGLETSPRREGGFFSALTLDPLAGLDPAVREIANTRLFAERALYAAQQAPQLLRWEAELISMQLADQPGPRALIDTSTSIASSLDRASRSAETLPDRIAAEREAILLAFEEQEGQLSALTRDVQQALHAGEQMSTALTATLNAFDALSKRFGVGEPRPARTPSPDARPFDVLDYAKTAREVADMAAELGEVLARFDTTLESPALEAQIANLDAVSGRATERVRSLLNHLFLLLAGLTLLVGVTVAVLRTLVPRRAKIHTPPPPMA